MMFDIFKTKAPEPTPAPTTSPQPDGSGKIEGAAPSVEPVVSDKTDANGVVPNNLDTSESPLDPFKDLWDTKGVEKPNTDPVVVPLDTDKLQEVMGKVDLASVVTPEVMAVIAAGGEDATKAMMGAMNNIAQQSMMQSTVVANKLVENAVEKTIKAMEAKIPGLVKAQSVDNSLAETNPLFSDPAVAPIIESTKVQLLTKYPNATTAEITDMAQKFVVAMSNHLNPTPEKPNPALPSGDQDFSTFLESEQSL